MTDRLKKILIAIAALAALALGGAAIAGAASGGDDSPAQERSEGAESDDGAALRGTTLERASAAALKATGGDTIGETERDGEKGATYEVEVAKPDGSQVDVRLDEQFSVVAIDGDGGE